MDNITMEELKEVVSMKKHIQSVKERIYDRCVEVMEWLNDNDPDCDYVLPDKNKVIYGNTMYVTSIDDGYVEVHVSEDWAYGGHEDYYYYLPFEHIVNDDWHEEYLKKVEEKRLSKEQKQKLEEEQKQKELEEHDRKEYERLKAKFEGE